MRFWSSAAVVLLAATSSSAGQTAADSFSRIERPEDAGSGTLALARHDGMVAAPVVAADYVVSIGGILARTRLRQTFENTTGEWVEGIYVYPLPDAAAVDHLELLVDDRRIRGEIRERQLARAEYDRARAGGRLAGLLESERPNLFTTSIANIGPGQRVSIEIAYQQTVRYQQGRFQLRLPLVVGPGYAIEDPHSASAGSGPRRISPIVRDASASPANPVNVRASLDAGMPIIDVRSLYHEVTQRFVSPSAREIELSYRDAPADRDFVLEWSAAAPQPVASVFRERQAGSEYALLQLFPPAGVTPRQLSRDIVFVIDTSGSMDGTSIDQAREALLFALQQLVPDDRFNVIRFASDTQLLFTAPVAASADRVSEASQYVRALSSGGGTEMFHALNAALRQFSGSESEPERVRQVVFMTDGNVGNEQALFQLIRSLLGSTRLYTVGIGSAPNGYFMAAAARFGRGTHTFIGNVSEVQERMTALFAKIAAPVLTDIEIEWPDHMQHESFPQRVSDLFVGEPALIAIRGPLPAPLTISARMAGAAWSQQIEANAGAKLPGVARYWAGQRVRSLLETPHRAVTGDPIYDAVVATALEHRLVSRYTSLHAVEDAPIRAAGQPLHERVVPINVPAGWRAADIGARLPGTATGAAFYLAAGLGLLLLALAGWLLGRRAL